MVSVVIAALSGTASIGTAGLMDALNKADLSQALQSGRPAGRVFDVQLAGLGGGIVSCRDGVRLHPSIAAADVTAPDLVVVPGLDDDLAAFGRERSHDDALVHQVQQHIDLHLDGPLRISELASRFGLSERTLSRRFVAATGRGPQAYLQHARIQQAMRLLETASDPIDQVRRHVGYSDPAAFRRIFKEATGLSPGAYRHAYGPRNDPGTVT